MSTAKALLGPERQQRLHAVRWLRPSSEPSTEWLEERFAQHLRALAPHACGPLPAPRAELARSAIDACTRAGVARPQSEETVAWASAIGGAFSALAARARDLDEERRTHLVEVIEQQGREAPADGWHAMEMVLDAAVRPVLWPDRPYATSPRTPDDPVRWIQQRGVHAFVKDTEWSFLFDTPSPWAPIFELWEAGLWPFVTADGRLIAWTPTVRADSVIVADPANPQATLPMLGFVTPNTPQDLALRALRDLALTLGVADAPGTFTYPPVGNPPGPR